MEKEFVPYELALKLKELGFDERCFASYYTDVEKNKTEKYDVRKKLNASFDWNPFTDEEDSGYILNSDKEYYVSSPLWQQAFDWLLINFNFWQYTFPNAHNKDWCYHIQWYKKSFGWGESFIQNGFKTQKEARLECLKKLIELVELKKDSV